jgi:hypothetical protein
VGFEEYGECWGMMFVVVLRGCRMSGYYQIDFVCFEFE